MAYRVGVDIGGTFTDFAILEESTGALRSLKVLSAPSDPGSEVIAGLRQMRERFGIAPEQISYFTHGTTVGINTVIQRNGARLALFVTEGFGDVLELARLRVPDFYHLLSHRPEPLVDRERVFGVRERLRADGSVETPVDEASITDAVERARGLDVTGIVIAFLHAYRNDANERAARHIIGRIAPELAVVCSSDVWPIIREYERTTTAVIHGYVQPRVARYLTALQAALVAEGMSIRPMLTKSNGGVMTAELGKTQCIHMLLSGTASGVIGASYVARRSGFDRVMSLDIGGTSADVALIRDGQPEFRSGELVGEFPIYIPTVSVSSIGQGGGSIAGVNSLGLLTVGPDSAGSTPGPACYRRGGTRPTVTDALAVMGFIGQSKLGYGAVEVDVQAAEAAIGTIATRLGRTSREAAEAIVTIAVSGMYREVTRMVARQGEDAREYAILAFGGAGPMLACWLAREVGMATVIVPPTPGVLSALGGLIADVKNDFIRTAYVRLTRDGLPAIRATLDQLLENARRWITEEQRFEGAATFLRSADMRYLGQSFEIEVPLDPEMIGQGDVDGIAAAFHERHRAIYGHADPAAAVQIVNLRVVALGTGSTPAGPEGSLIEGRAAPRRAVVVWCDGAERTVPLYDRADLSPGQSFTGPAVIAQEDTTTCVPPGFTGRVDRLGNLLLSLVA